MFLEIFCGKCSTTF